MNDGCTCDYPRRKAQNEADWAAPREIGRLWPPLPVLHRADCLSLKDYPLVPWRVERPCVKCGSSDIASQFHTAMWHYQPHRHDYWRVDLFRWECALTFHFRPVEHIDRRCRACHYAWLEQTAEAVV